MLNRKGSNTPKTKEQIQSELEVLRKKKQIQDELNRLKGIRDQRKRHNAITYFSVNRDGKVSDPHKKQAEFFHDRSKIRIILGGNRSGKTHCAVAECVAHAKGYRPWLPPDHPDYKIDIKVPNKGIIVGESFGEQVKKVIVRKLFGDDESGTPGLIPTDEIAETKKNQQGIITYVKLTNGSTMDIQSYDQDVGLFEGTDYDWAYPDEPPPRPIWVAIKRGLTDSNGPCWFAMTPLKEPWIYDELMSRPDVGKYYFDIEDNLGYGLTREGIDEFAKTLNDDEKEARLRGKFFHLSGLVYKTYGDVNRIKRCKIDPSWLVWMHIDTHPRTPHRAVWIAVAPNGLKYVCGGIRNHDNANRIEPFAAAIKTFEKEILKVTPDVITRLIEPGASTPNPMKDGINILDEFALYGIDCKPGSKNRDAGILLLQNELRHEPQIGVYPTIYFFDDLDEIHYEMNHYVWDDWAVRASYGRTDKQVPKDKDDHYIEGIHRILLDSPICYYNEPQEEYVGSHGNTGANKFTGY